MGADREKAATDWASFLDPSKVRGGLIATGVYLVAYEILCQALVEQPKGFFATDYEDLQPLPSEDYKEHVLSLHRMPYYASAQWFKQMGAFTDEDVDCLEKIREHRNELAHETPEFVLTSDKEMNRDLLKAIVELVSKIDLWWIREIEISINPEVDGMSVDEIMQADTFSARMWMLDLIVDFVTTDGAKLARLVAALGEFDKTGTARDLN